MRLVTGITLLLALGVLGDSKTTQPNSMEGTEEEPVHLPCNHSTISGPEYVYWYRQIPHQGPEHLIHGLNNNMTNRMASLSIAKDRKSSILVLPQVTVKDIAVYYCVLRGTHWDRQGCTCASADAYYALPPKGPSVAQTVTQPQPEVSVQEAGTVTLDCTYSTSDSDYYLFWYKQPPSGEMVFIIRQYAYERQNATNDRYSVNFQKEAKAFNLRISDSQLEDAVMYFCAYSGAQ
ncbi:unnamed protein product [Rangifer tarandus platyrhynchus]|uniref:Ig-like domain-containing protein n=1 Tax=Rangifer tarandus platyrhynchus TaxID=3082113 RepID=A0ABN8ZWG9_RANTA|nr:unnamed protein product [Rangifer tarandus platyrhynchus]